MLPASSEHGLDAALRKPPVRADGIIPFLGCAHGIVGRIGGYPGSHTLIRVGSALRVGLLLLVGPISVASEPNLGRGDTIGSRGALEINRTFWVATWILY